MYSYFKADSVIGLVANGTNIQVKKLGAADAYNDAATGTELTTFILQEADMIRLQAPEINTILGLQAADKGVALTFTPDEQGERLLSPTRSMERMLANSWLKLFLVIMIMYLC